MHLYGNCPGSSGSLVRPHCLPGCHFPVQNIFEAAADLLAERLVLFLGHAGAGLSDCLATSALCDLRSKCGICRCSCRRVYAGAWPRQSSRRMVILVFSEPWCVDFWPG